MPFHTYMLTCADGTIYTGQSDDLEQRIAQHHAGYFRSCYTFKRRPVTVLWSGEFPTRQEALEAERQLKGWSAAKKRAMVAGDWDLVVLLARNWQG